jgi:hypothetical protein
MTHPTHEHCRASDLELSDVCPDCSGLKTRVNGVIAILGILCTLLIAVLTQGNNIRAEVAKEIARLDAADKACSYEIQTIRRDVSDVGRRVTFLEGK